MQPPLQEVGPLARLAGVEPGVGPAGLLLQLEFFRAVVPVADLLGEAVLDRRLGLGDEIELGAAHLGQVFRHDLGDGVALGPSLQLAVEPLALGPVEEGRDAGLAGRQGPVVEIGRVMDVAGGARGVLLHIEHPLGDDPALAGAGESGVLDGVLQIEEHPGLGARIALVHQDGAAFQQVAIALQGEVDDGVEQGVTGADEGGLRLALGRYPALVEGDAFVAWLHGLADPDEAVAVAHRRRDMADLVAAGLALLDGAAEPLEGREEEGFDVVGLQATGVGPLHVLADALDPAGVHGVVGQHPLFDQVLQVAPVEADVEDGIEEGLDLVALAIADRLDQELAQGLPLELELAEYVEDLAAQGLARLFQFFQQLAINVAFAGLLRHQVPEVADLVLADAVDAAEALFQPVGVPGQVVVDHEVGALEVDALPRRIGGQQHLDLRIVLEGPLNPEALLAADAAVDDDHGVAPAQKPGDAALQIIEGVAMLGEDDQLLVWRGRGRWDRPRAVRQRGLGDAMVQAGRGEDLAEQARQFAPLGVGAAAAYRQGLGFEPLQGVDLAAQLGDGARGGGLIEDRLLGGLDLVVRRFFQVGDVVGVELGQGGGDGRATVTALKHLQLAQPALQPLAATAQGLVNGLRRGGEPPLQDGQGEADGAGALVVFQGLGAVELLAHILGDRLVERGLGVRELVGHRVGDALGEEGRAVELEQALLDHAAHEIGDVGGMDAIAEAALEAVAIQQGHEELKVRLLAVVGRGRHEEEVSGQGREQLSQPVALGVFDLVAEHRGGQLVGLVADHQVPAAVRGLELLLHLLVARQLVEAGNDQVGFEKPVAGARRLQLVVGEDLEGQMKAATQLVLPLFGQTAGADDEAALQVAPGDQLLDEQTGHDGLAGAGVIGQQIAQGLARQHGLVNGGDLVGQRIDHGGVHRQHRVEEMGEADAVGLRDQAEEGAVAVETPGPALLQQLQAGLVVTVEQLVGDLAGRGLVGQLQGLGTEPLDTDHRHQGIGDDAANGGVGLELFELHGREGRGLVLDLGVSLP